MIDLLKKVTENQRFRIIAYITGGAIAVILLCFLIISIINGGEKITDDIVVTAYSSKFRRVWCFLQIHSLYQNRLQCHRRQNSRINFIQGV